MNFIELIEKATEAAGSQRQLAQRIGIDAPKISEWRKGKYKPSAEHIALLAEIAGEPVLSTLAEVQSSLNPQGAEVWKRALEKLKAAGVTASAILILGMGFPAEKANADNGLRTLHSVPAKYTS